MCTTTGWWARELPAILYLCSGSRGKCCCLCLTVSEMTVVKSALESSVSGVSLAPPPCSRPHPLQHLPSMRAKAPRQSRERVSSSFKRWRYCSGRDCLNWSHTASSICVCGWVGGCVGVCVRIRERSSIILLDCCVLDQQNIKTAYTTKPNHCKRIRQLSSTCSYTVP